MSWGKNDQDLLRKMKDAIQSIHLDANVTTEVEFRTTLSNSEEELHRHVLSIVLGSIISSKAHDANISVINDVTMAMMYADEVLHQYKEREEAKRAKRRAERFGLIHENVQSD